MALAAAALAAGFALSGWWVLALLPALPGGLWALGRVRGWHWTPSLGLALIILMAGAGLRLGLWPGLALVGVVAALSGWDLDQLLQRARQAGRVEGWEELQRRHLLRLLAVDATGLSLGAAALLLPVRLSFFAALALGILLAAGLTQVIAYLRQGHEG